MREETSERRTPVEHLCGGVVVLLMLAAFLWPGLPGGSPVGRDIPTVETHLNRASYLVKSEEETLAEEELRKALSLDPGSQPAHQNLGNLLMMRGLYDEAEKEYQAALTGGPNAAAHYNLGLLARKRGRPEEAVAHLESALRLDPSPEAILHLGRAHRIAGRHDRSIELLEGLVRAHPFHAAALYELGIAYLESGRRDRARALFGRVLQLQPSHGPARERLSSLGGPVTPETEEGAALR